MDNQKRDAMHQLQIEYDALKRVTAKRAAYMRDALHAIFHSADSTTADELREIAYTAWKADNLLVRVEFEKATKRLRKKV